MDNRIKLVKASLLGLLVVGLLTAYSVIYNYVFFDRGVELVTQRLIAYQLMSLEFGKGVELDEPLEWSAKVSEERRRIAEVNEKKGPEDTPLDDVEYPTGPFANAMRELIYANEYPFEGMAPLPAGKRFKFVRPKHSEALQGEVDAMLAKLPQEWENKLQQATWDMYEFSSMPPLTKPFKVVLVWSTQHGDSTVPLKSADEASKPYALFPEGDYYVPYSADDLAGWIRSYTAEIGVQTESVTDAYRQHLSKAATNSIQVPVLGLTVPIRLAVLLLLLISLSSLITLATNLHVLNGLDLSKRGEPWVLMDFRESKGWLSNLLLGWAEILHFSVILLAPGSAALIIALGAAGKPLLPAPLIAIVLVLQLIPASYAMWRIRFMNRAVPEAGDS